MTPWTAACQASLSFTISWSLLTHVHWVGDAIQPFHHLSSPSPAFIFPSIGVFCNELALCSRWPKYWSFSISPSNEYSGLFPLGLTGLNSLLSKGLSRYYAAAAKSLQSCLTLCNPIDGSPSGSPRPWDSPGENTGVGCHFLLPCRKVKSESEVAQSCPTLSDPVDCSLPGSSVHGIFQARVLEWGAIAFSARYYTY